MCIKEGMRCHNPVPNVSRELTKPLVLDGVELLPGTAVNIQIGNCVATQKKTKQPIYSMHYELLIESITTV